eukprot:CAMPEP_0173391246 /NCGR_PEP_ID=MMETSP1356-20130122/17921_1 /TAXON_ID=77927 ORGANISM="Hemiselmis virescens, Strain PCC157" /NCGR_SAMPLE_ID=MMETSP1356 /ASSEMBLY_ACC=CAM_ASM_000847 /LENGTH=78 /DNA_ID=CAMNT_0014348827 /DNA_START=323 /DNA_END=559 /DNA_ORIENTATION=-
MVPTRATVPPTATIPPITGPQVVTPSVAALRKCVAGPEPAVSSRRTSSVALGAAASFEASPAAAAAVLLPPLSKFITL